jgi:hypothetical protein
MLTFSALGPSSFRLTGGATPIVAFPETVKASKDAITLASVPEDKQLENVISWPGEYNMGGVSFRGIGHDEGKQVSYIADVDGIRVGFVSSPLKDWSDKQLESVGDIDALVMPAGDAKLAQKLVDEIDPRVLILLPTKDKDALKAVEKVIGVKERSSEYKIKGSLPQEGREVVVLA